MTREQTLAAVRSTFIRHGAVDRLVWALNDLGRVLTADPNAPIRDDKRIVVLTGAPGAGKSTMLRAAWRHASAVSEAGLKRLHVKVPSSITLHALGVTILRKFNLTYVAGRRESRGEIWPVVRDQLGERGFRIVELEEAQDILDSKREDEKMNIANVLKKLVQEDEQCDVVDQVLQQPLGLVIVGTERFLPFIESKGETARRSRFVTVPPLGDADHQWMREVVGIFAKAGGLNDKIPNGDDTIGRLIHAREAAFGETVASIRAACELAIESGHEDLSIHHFAESYARDRDCSDAANPFLAADWRDLDTSRAHDRSLPGDRLEPDVQTRRKR
jgi:hypothetical protein